jgi:hypothetical protein
MLIQITAPAFTRESEINKLQKQKKTTIGGM